MGNTSGSMIYGLLGLLILYFAAVIIFKIVDVVSKWLKGRNKK